MTPDVQLVELLVESKLLQSTFAFVSAATMFGPSVYVSTKEELKKTLTGNAGDEGGIGGGELGGELGGGKHSSHPGRTYEPSDTQ